MSLSPKVVEECRRQALEILEHALAGLRTDEIRVSHFELTSPEPEFYAGFVPDGAITRFVLATEEFVLNFEFHETEHGRRKRKRNKRE